MPACYTIDKFLNTMPQAHITRIVVDPKARGWAPVGHVNVFRTCHQTNIWPALADWVKYGKISSALQGDRWNSSGLRDEPIAMAKM